MSSQGTLVGITSGYEPYLPMAAKLANSLGYPGPSPQAMHICTNKETTCETLHAKGVGVPNYRAVTDAAAAVRAAEALGLPVILKPVNSGGSLGDKLCSTVDEVHTHATNLLYHTTTERGLPMLQRILVQETIQGPEYSVEAFSGTIVGITRKHLGELPYFIERGHDFPAVLDTEQVAQLSQITLDALNAVGLDRGPAHVEVRVDATGPKIIEINPRLGGDNITTLVRLATGIDLYDATLRAIRGVDYAVTPVQENYASIRFLMATVPGRVIQRTGIEDARALPGIYDVKISVGIGDDVRLYHDSRDRLGYVIAVGGTPMAAEQHAEAALRVLTVTLREA